MLLSGVTPFGGACEGDDLQEVKQNILSGEVSFDDPCWDVVSEEAIGFIKSMVRDHGVEDRSGLKMTHHAEQ